MKVGDSVYLVTDQLKTGAGIPAMICEMQDSTVKVAIEETNGTRVLQAKTWDVFPSSLFTHSVLNIVYQTYLEIERDCGSILNLKPDAVSESSPSMAWHRRLRVNASICLMKWTGAVQSSRFANG